MALMKSTSTSFWGQTELAISFHARILFGLFFDPKNVGDAPPKRRVTFNGLRGVTAQTTLLFRLFTCSTYSLTLKMQAMFLRNVR
jgi:hypothetical protein